VLSRMVGVSAVALVGGLAVAGCAPVQMGAAAIVGNQRVSVTTLDTEAGILASAAKPYSSIVSLTQTQITQETLQWLIRFQINEQLASSEGITVSPGSAQQALNQIYSEGKADAEQSGISNASNELILVANGIPPNMSNEVGRYQAIENQFIEGLNGGKIPTDQTTLTNDENKLTHAQCLAAKTLNIKVNPQFGRMDFANYTVVATTDAVSRPSGTAQTASVSGLTPAC
jgi:hypothetical protein